LEQMEHLRLGLVGLAVLFFLFQIFRKLKEDYDDEEVVKASLLGVVVCFSLWWLGKRYELGLFAILMGLVIVVFIFSHYYSWRFWEVLESAALPGLVSLFIAKFIQWESAVYLLVILSNLVWRNYRRFSWYPSGKMGFLFLVNLAILSLFNILLDFWQQRLLKSVVWLVVFLICLGVALLLSGRKKETKNGRISD